MLNSLAKAAELLTYPGDGLIARVKKIKEKPDEVKRVIRAGIKANRYIRDLFAASANCMVRRKIIQIGGCRYGIDCIRQHFTDA